MGSDSGLGKKEGEREDLSLFLEARAWVTGENLSWIPWQWTESPDFVCVRADGQRVGVELTKVTVDHDAAMWDRTRYGRVRIDASVTLETIYSLIGRKEKARTERYTERVKDNILALQLVHGSLDQVAYAFDGLEAAFACHGFVEVWLADHSGLEAYGDVELFGLYPGQWWGPHSRPGPGRKPYG